ncbi:hypothetical protein AZF37_08005 [endosymbiont 'TC1' of Trimyema compressum]|uniref:hypothetical protein n=1 Tax=endosymbiont 'TC1' of Trimyema compressum TaxID=243899 RepID=UPI0007F0F4F2|nr:hypothetical protein [endosymbiont 'TC1' of Trimyema compressum]AMP21107.1 hypothetical protein AZF37_08005 [endosymbiont 'TC1' of Trimyema compressum]
MIYASITIIEPGVFINNDNVETKDKIQLNLSNGITDIATCKIDPISDQTYNGNEAEPKPVITSGGTTLEEGIDYMLNYTDNVNAGLAKVNIIGIGNYNNVNVVNFKINKRECTIKVGFQDKIYDGTTDVIIDIVLNNLVSSEKEHITAAISDLANLHFISKDVGMNEIKTDLPLDDINSYIFMDAEGDFTNNYFFSYDVPQTMSATIIKANPAVVSKPIASVISSSKKLSEITLTGGVVNGVIGSVDRNINESNLQGIWTWVNPDITVTSSDNYIAQFVPTSQNYSVIVTDVKVSLLSDIVTDDKYVLQAKEFTITEEEVNNLNILEKAEAKAWNYQTDEDGVSSIILSGKVENNVGEYPIIIAVNKNTNLTKTINITVTGGNQKPTNPNINNYYDNYSNNVNRYYLPKTGNGKLLLISLITLGIGCLGSYRAIKKYKS